MLGRFGAIVPRKVGDPLRAKPLLNGKISPQVIEIAKKPQKLGLEIKLFGLRSLIVNPSHPNVVL